MTQTTLEPVPKATLSSPENATRTSDYEISEEARDAYASRVLDALEAADDLLIALEIRRRDVADKRGGTELADFIREQGYDPADFAV